MDSLSWTDKKQQFKNKPGANKKQRQVIDRVKKGIKQGNLSNIESVMCSLCNHPDHAPAVIARLNNSVDHFPCVFRWFPGNNSKSSKLLIRNNSVGLLVKTAQDSASASAKSSSPSANQKSVSAKSKTSKSKGVISQGMIITPGKAMPFISLKPEFALFHLSSKTQPAKVTNGKRRSHLRLVP